VDVEVHARVPGSDVLDDDPVRGGGAVENRVFVGVAVAPRAPAQNATV
jgi:hypothetical protein